MKIGIIGIGSIGKRYLESVLALNNEYEIYCIEPRKEIAESLRQEYGGDKITVGTQIKDLPSMLDLCAITTTADVRRQVFHEIIGVSRVRYIIFEKVLFQKEDDYADVGEVLRQKGIKAWVNCTRREFDSYTKLKMKLDKAQCFTLSAGGNEWGLGCNGIHLIDLVQYLGGKSDMYIDTESLLPPVVQSKRRNFLEYYGTIKGYTGKCNAFQIACMKAKGVSPIVVAIHSDIGDYVIDETSKRIHFAETDNGWKWESGDFPLPYTSQIMGKIIDKIIRTGECNLPAYQVSMDIHLKYIRGVKKFLKAEAGWESETCPIT